MSLFSSLVKAAPGACVRLPLPRKASSLAKLFSTASKASIIDASVSTAVKALHSHAPALVDVHAPEFVATEGMLHQACTSLVDEFDAGTHEGKHKLVLALADACDTLSQPEVQRLFTTTCQVHPLGVSFATECRAWSATSSAPSISRLAKTLEPLLAVWYGAGFLELREINWDSPGRTLEWIAKYESVHPTDQLGRFRQRFEGHLKCFGLFHGSETWKPVAFVHVALTCEPPTSVQRIWSKPTSFPTRAVFYSISASHPGLKGIRVPRQLLYRVQARLASQLPTLATYITLSPVPGFAKWVREKGLEQEKQLIGKGAAQSDFNLLSDVVHAPSADALQSDASMLQASLHRLMVQYLSQSPASKSFCPVARFHLGNGAHIAGIHYLANPSAKGLEDSVGMMANYEYGPDLVLNRGAFSRGVVVSALAKE